MHTEFLQAAVDEAAQSIDLGGGPFGAVLVREGAILARGQNRVTSSFDPTAHAEVMAIRAACQLLSDHRLTGTTLYASTEPCPLCLAASLWARIDRIYYATTREDAGRAGFDDALFYRELALPERERNMASEHIVVAGATGPLERWAQLEGKIRY